MVVSVSLRVPVVVGVVVVVVVAAGVEIEGIVDVSGVAVVSGGGLQADKAIVRASQVMQTRSVDRVGAEASYWSLAHMVTLTHVVLEPARALNVEPSVHATQI